MVSASVGEDDCGRRDRDKREVVGRVFFAADFGERGNEGGGAFDGGVLCGWEMHAQ